MLHSKKYLHSIHLNKVIFQFSKNLNTSFKVIITYLYYFAYNLNIRSYWGCHGVW